MIPTVLAPRGYGTQCIHAEGINALGRAGALLQVSRQAATGTYSSYYHHNRPQNINPHHTIFRKCVLKPLVK